MTDDDLIRRGDALALTRDPFGRDTVTSCAIAALPAAPDAATAVASFMILSNGNVAVKGSPGVDTAKATEMLAARVGILGKPAVSAPVAELVEAAAAMLDRHVLYCGGPDLPFGGHTDRALFDRLAAALAKIGEPTP